MKTLVQRGSSAKKSQGHLLSFPGPMEFVGAVGIYSNKHFAANYLANDFRRRLLSTGTIQDYQDNHDHGLQTPVRKLPSLHCRKSTPTPKFVGTAEAFLAATSAKIFNFARVTL
jgi:hypothetical protein